MSEDEIVEVMARAWAEFMVVGEHDGKLYQWNDSKPHTPWTCKPADAEQCEIRDSNGALLGKMPAGDARHICVAVMVLHDLQAMLTASDTEKG